MAGGPAGSLHGRVGLVAADGEFDLADAALQANQVLLQLGFLLLDAADLVLQFHIFNLLGREISLQLVLNSTPLNLLAWEGRSDLPVCLDLEGLAHFGGLVAEHVLELLLFLAEHLNFALAKHNVVLNVAGNILHSNKQNNQHSNVATRCRSTRNEGITSSLARVPFNEPFLSA